jgi:hypothetical protein
MRNFLEPCAVENRFGGSATANDALCGGLQITNDVLYQLSYRGVRRGW